eukprot:186272-Chlamydomonas_euryale.AAC.1
MGRGRDQRLCRRADVSSGEKQALPGAVKTRPSRRKRGGKGREGGSRDQAAVQRSCARWVCCGGCIQRLSALVVEKGCALRLYAKAVRKGVYKGCAQ